MLLFFWEWAMMDIYPLSLTMRWIIIVWVNTTQAELLYGQKHTVLKQLHLWEPFSMCGLCFLSIPQKSINKKQLYKEVFA